MNERATLALLVFLSALSVVLVALAVFAMQRLVDGQDRNKTLESMAFLVLRF
jgi:hypothetical protein